MEALKLGDPWDPATDVGPVIDAEAEDGDQGLPRRRGGAGAVLKTLPVPERGRFVPPTVVAVDGIGAVEREVFGPVLHVAGFRAAELDRVVDAINARGFGLTFGLHSRIDDRVERVTARLHVGNAYVNRNQIGAIVGSQPFGGEGLSGTGPKAGGPFYLPRLQRGPAEPAPAAPEGPEIAPRGAGRGLRGARRRRLGGAGGPGGGAAARRSGPAGGLVGAALGGGRGAAAGAARPAGADRREQPAEPASARAGALPRRRRRGGAGAGGAGAGGGQRRARGGGRGARRRWRRSRALPVAAHRRAGRARRASSDLAEPGAGRGGRAGGLAAGAAPGAQPARRADRAAGDRRWSTPSATAVERHLCIDTTAAGGNASLLAASA